MPEKKKTQKINYLRTKDIEAFKRRLIEETKEETVNPGRLTIKGKTHWTL